MASSVKLSNGEIATLLEGVRSGTLAAETGIGSDKDYQAFHLGLDNSSGALSRALAFEKHDKKQAAHPLQRLTSTAAYLRSKMQQNNDNRDDDWSNRLSEAVLNITREITPRIFAPVLQITDRLQMKRGAGIGTGALENMSIITDNTTNITARMDHPNGN